jgi:hypothetical protein
MATGDLISWRINTSNLRDYASGIPRKVKLLSKRRGLEKNLLPRERVFGNLKAIEYIYHVHGCSTVVDPLCLTITYIILHTRLCILLHVSS